MTTDAVLYALFLLTACIMLAVFVYESRRRTRKFDEYLRHMDKLAERLKEHKGKDDG